jgi:hypothetical protein
VFKLFLLQDNASIRDIQTDETMPPQGELSEQESIGADSASLWGPAAEDVSFFLLAIKITFKMEISESNVILSLPKLQF